MIFVKALQAEVREQAVKKTNSIFSFLSPNIRLLSPLIPALLFLPANAETPYSDIFTMANTKLERDFQADLVKEIKKRFDGCIVTKLDTSLNQGFPDLLVLYKDRWATLECKRSAKASKRPNQEYYVKKMDEMSFSRFISPENREEVLSDLQQAFRID